MSQLEALVEDINVLRGNLEQLIEVKQGNLIDAEVITASNMLNAALNEYNKSIYEKFTG